MRRLWKSISTDVRPVTCRNSRNLTNVRSVESSYPNSERDRRTLLLGRVEEVRGVGPSAGVSDVRGDVMFRANLRRTGTYDTRGVPKLTQLKWKFKTGGWVSSSPTVTRDDVLFGSLDGNFYSVDKETAQERWNFKTGGSIYSSGAIVGSVVFFGSLDGAAYGLDFLNGERKFKFATEGPIYSSPAVADGTIYFGSLDGNLHAVDVLRQTARWKFKTGGPVYSAPAISGGIVYFGSLDGNLYAVEIGSGKVAWKLKTSGPVSTAAGCRQGRGIFRKRGSAALCRG